MALPSVVPRFSLCLSGVNPLMNKWLFIQALRGVAVLGVVAFHSMSIEKKYSSGNLLLPDFLLLGQSGVDLFFVISGFVMVTVTMGRFARDREMLRFLWGRFTRIYPTYWFYFFLTAVVYFIKPSWVNSLYGHQTELLTSFLLFPNQQPLVMVAWSLSHELWFYSIFAVLLNVKERWLLPSLLVWGMIVAMVNVFATTAKLSAGIRVALHPYTLEFIIGALVAIFVVSECSRKISVRLSFMVIVILLVVGGPVVYAFDILKEAGVLRVGVLGTLYGLLVLALAILEREKKFIVPRFLQSVGDMSYTVYLSHILILNAVGRLWAMANPGRSCLVDNMIFCLLMVASVVSYGWVGYRLVEQPISFVTHRLRTRWFSN
jgi:peptidoglycan/LPS O-acetylase OafA/YrhL